MLASLERGKCDLWCHCVNMVPKRKEHSPLPRTFQSSSSNTHYPRTDLIEFIPQQRGMVGQLAFKCYILFTELPSLLLGNIHSSSCHQTSPPRIYPPFARRPSPQNPLAVDGQQVTQPPKRGIIVMKVRPWSTRVDSSRMLWEGSPPARFDSIINFDARRAGGSEEGK